jgi:hypothetical protein
VISEADDRYHPAPVMCFQLQSSTVQSVLVFLSHQAAFHALRQVQQGGDLLLPTVAASIPQLVLPWPLCRSGPSLPSVLLMAADGC